jgi:hypothetical protein
VKKKGKGVTRPVESGEGAALPPGSEEASSTAYGGAGIAALVGGSSCHGDNATSSNVPTEMGGRVVDPAPFAVPSINVVVVAAMTETTQVAACPVTPLDPVWHHVEATSWVAPQS